MGPGIFVLDSMSGHSKDYDAAWEAYRMYETIDQVMEETGMRIKKRERKTAIRLEGRRDMARFVHDAKVMAMSDGGPQKLYVQWVWM